MSSPNSRISPSMRASGFSSCMRFKARRKVDLPQPLGPMMAVTVRAAISIDTLLSTLLPPKKNGRLPMVNAGEPPTFGPGGVVSTGWAVSVMVFIFSRFGLETIAGQKAHADIDGQHQH